MEKTLLVVFSWEGLNKLGECQTKDIVAVYDNKTKFQKDFYFLVEGFPHTFKEEDDWHSWFDSYVEDNEDEFGYFYETFQPNETNFKRTQ